MRFFSQFVLVFILCQTLANPTLFASGQRGVKSSTKTHEDSGQRNTQPQVQVVNPETNSVTHYKDYAGLLDQTEKLIVARMNERSKIVAQFEEKVSAMLSKSDIPFNDIMKPKVEYLAPNVLQNYLNKIQKERFRSASLNSGNSNVCLVDQNMKRSNAAFTWTGLAIGLGGVAVGGFGVAKWIDCGKNDEKEKEKQKLTKDQEEFMKKYGFQNSDSTWKNSKGELLNIRRDEDGNMFVTRSGSNEELKMLPDHGGIQTYVDGKLVEGNEGKKILDNFVGTMTDPTKTLLPRNPAGSPAPATQNSHLQRSSHDDGPSSSFLPQTGWQCRAVAGAMIAAGAAAVIVGVKQLLEKDKDDAKKAKKTKEAKDKTEEVVQQHSTDNATLPSTNTSVDLVGTTDGYSQNAAAAVEALGSRLGLSPKEFRKAASKGGTALDKMIGPKQEKNYLASHAKDAASAKALQGFYDKFGGASGASDYLSTLQNSKAFTPQEKLAMNNDLQSIFKNIGGGSGGGGGGHGGSDFSGPGSFNINLGQKPELDDPIDPNKMKKSRDPSSQNFQNQEAPESTTIFDRVRRKIYDVFYRN